MSILTAISILIILAFVWIYKGVFYPNDKFNLQSTAVLLAFCAIPYLRGAVALVCVTVFVQHAWLKYKKTPV